MTEILEIATFKLDTNYSILNEKSKQKVNKRLTNKISIKPLHIEKLIN